MNTIYAMNVNEALARCLNLLDAFGVEEDSRNGKVLAMPAPTCIAYQYPRQCVLFSPLRNANPFFHLMEALWMLAGRNDLAWPLYFNSGFGKFSDDGITLHGAYGFRWRQWFGRDQLFAIVNELQTRPNSRRAVLSMWSAAPALTRDGKGHSDLHMLESNGKDVPCNTHAYFTVRDGKLDMTVCNRSNDLVWGACGANAVHFAILQQFMAAAIGVHVGTYYQFTNNLHVYLDVVPRTVFQDWYNDALDTNLYIHADNVDAYNMFGGLPPQAMANWLFDLDMFLQDPLSTANATEHHFFPNVARPMYKAWKQRKEGASDLEYMPQLREIPAGDWRVASVEWMERANQRRRDKQLSQETRP